MRINNFAKFAWGVLAYNLLVILWGAYVRATGSGAGCGSHWPLCNGVVIPLQPQIETIIEFTHRLMSGLSLILVVIMFIWAFRSYRKRHPVRLGATFSLIFILTEALVGAGLVLFQWVAQDASLGRAVSIVIHLLNTFMLLAALTLTAWWASGGKPIRVQGSSLSAWLLGIGLLGTLLMGASGALAALGDTLFPAESLLSGIQQDFSPTAHFLIRLRLLHPTIAIVVGIFLIIAVGVINLRSSDWSVRRFARLLTVCVAVQMGAGFLNVLLLAPVWMQVIHLLLADLVWIFLILLSATHFAVEGEESAKIHSASQPPLIHENKPA
jgi:heme A synthase